MSRLVLLNGPPAAGKSTLARRYAAATGATIVETDALVGADPAWRHDPRAAGNAARTRALRIAEAELRAGREVVVPQYVGRGDFVEALTAVAAGARAPFVHVCLLLDPDEAVRRFLARAASPDPLHRHAAERVEVDGGLESVRAALARVRTVCAEYDGRPVRSTDPDTTYDALMVVLSRPA